MWVEVATLEQGTVLVDPYTLLYSNYMCLAGIGVENCLPDKNSVS